MAGSFVLFPADNIFKVQKKISLHTPKHITDALLLAMGSGWAGWDLHCCFYKTGHGVGAAFFLAGLLFFNMAKQQRTATPKDKEDKKEYAGNKRN
jgi:hypothetical protein